MSMSEGWGPAQRAAEGAGISLVRFDQLDDADRVRSVIDQVWGEQVLPREMIRAFQHAGSVLYGATAEGQDVGFVLGFAGLDGGGHLHSHMLGVIPGWQDRGVGYALKLAQRAVSLDHGLDEIRWTYDPLLARNARFNLVKLGTVGVMLLRDFYGAMQDRLNAGDRSDRFEVRWAIRSERVERALRGEPVETATGPALLDATEAPGTPWPRPVRTDAAPEPGATVAIPGDLPALRAADPALARAWRDAVADVAEECFNAGTHATWFTGDGRYVFEEAAG